MICRKTPVPAALRLQSAVPWMTAVVMRAKERMKHCIAAELVVLAMIITCRCDAQELTVAAASDLSFALKEVAGKFEEQSGHKLKISYGSSGNFYAQIMHGAPFDIFFSADTQYPQELVDSRLAEPGTLQVYAVGHLVLWL